MTINSRVLKWSLLAGALYFFSVSLAHLLGIKVPVLFVYFNVPSQAYQDRIISFLAFGWAVFLFSAFSDPQKQRVLIKSVLIAGAGALIGLSINNQVTDFSPLGPEIDVNVFWLETAGIFIYWLWLVIFFFRSSKDQF